MSLTCPTWMLIALLQAGAPSSPATVASWRDFPVFVWHHAGDEPNERVLRAFGGTEIVAAEDASWARELGLSWFVFNAPGRDALHLDRDAPRERRRWQAWYEKRDDALLVREPCLEDPATQASLRSRLEASLAARAGEHGFGVSLGDEVSFTPGGAPEDLCLCAFCRDAWKRWLAARPELSDEERASLSDLAAISTDATRIALGEGRLDATGAWLLRRRFHQERMLAVLDELARASRERSPDTPVGLLGMSGQSAFGGVAVERVVPWLDFAECYRTSDARELLFTLRASSPRALLTVFVDAARIDHAAWQAWEHFVRGGDGLVVWSERALAKSPELCERLARAVRDVRSVRAVAPDFRPAPAGVALVHSADAIAYGWLREALLDGPTWPKRLQGWQEEHGTLETALRGWLALLEDCGVQPGAIPLGAVGADTVRRFPLLVLAHLAVLDEPDLERLRSYLAAGGRVLVQGDLGAIDSRGRTPSEPALARLLAAAPERVQVVGDSVAPYSLARVRGDAAATRWRERATSWLALAGVERAPWHWRGDAAEHLWISSWSRAPDTGALLCAALPAEGDAQFDRARSSDVRLALEPPKGFDVEWIHPAFERSSAEAPLLRAGDAAVFRLVPRE